MRLKGYGGHAHHLTMHTPRAASQRHLHAVCREPYLGLHACGKPPADFEEVS
jgi:hypothetical protein